jgi:RNA polymerase sigma-70 factor (ECF subfamily)
MPPQFGRDATGRTKHNKVMTPDKHSLISLLFAEHAKDLMSYVRGKSATETDPEDVVQEAFARLVQYASQLDVTNPRSFLYRTVGNLLIDRHRRRLRQQAHAALQRVTPDCAHSPSAERAHEGEATLQRFRACLQQLPPMCRHAFILHRLDGLSHQQIALQLNISPRTSERYVMQAMRLLVRELDLEDPDSG